MKCRFLLIVFIVILFSIGCLPPKYGINAYDEKNNITNYYLISYGGLIIPGKWNRDLHEKSTNQYSLIGPDSTNRFFISMSQPPRSILGFSPYTDSYHYLQSELALSEDKILQDDLMLGDSTNTFDIIEKDSTNNFLIFKYIRKNGRLTTQDIGLNGIKKRNL